MSVSVGPDVDDGESREVYVTARLTVNTECVAPHNAEAAVRARVEAALDELGEALQEPPELEFDS